MLIISVFLVLLGFCVLLDNPETLKGRPEGHPEINPLQLFNVDKGFERKVVIPITFISNELLADTKEMAELYDLFFEGIELDF